MQDPPARFFGKKVPENWPKQQKPPLPKQGRFVKNDQAMVQYMKYL